MINFFPLFSLILLTISGMFLATYSMPCEMALSGEICLYNVPTIALSSLDKIGMLIAPGRWSCSNSFGLLVSKNWTFSSCNASLTEIFLGILSLEGLKAIFSYDQKPAAILLHELIPLDHSKQQRPDWLY